MKLIMQLKYLLLSALFLLFSSLHLKAQQYYNQKPEFLRANAVWAFGNYAGLDFNSGSAKAIKIGTENYEATASACDPVTGELLFYVAQGGEECWNRNHQRMPNGFAMGGWKSTSQTCIVPVIDSPGKYYVFSNNMEGFANGRKDGLFYSIVDMSLDGGLGDVDTARKAIPMVMKDSNGDTILPCESIVAIQGNNCDVWLVTHKRIYNGLDTIYNPNVFIVFHITNKGIDLNYRTYNHSGPWYSTFYAGQMSVSPNRERIYQPSLGFLGTGTSSILCKFNPSSGEVYEAIGLYDTASWGGSTRDYSGVFSPDNSKLYLKDGQFDISVHNADTILNSRVPLSMPASYQKRLYNDTIYFMYATTDLAGNRIDSLGAITKPNLQGIACEVRSLPVALIPGTSTAFGGMGAELIYPAPRDTNQVVALDTIVCANNTSFSLKGSPGFSNYKWNNGIIDSILSITEAGTYWVLCSDIEGCHHQVDTFIIRGMNFAPPIITVDKFKLSTTASYDSYQWYLNGIIIQGAIDRTYNVTQNGDYTVSVTNELDCTSTSEKYKITNVNIGEFNTITNKISIYPNPAHDQICCKAPIKVKISVTGMEGKILNKESTNGCVSVRDLAAGMYLLQILDKDNTLLKVEKFIKRE